MLKKATFAAAALFLVVSVPTTLSANDCFDQCFINCMKFGQGDQYCSWYCMDQTCVAAK